MFAIHKYSNSFIAIFEKEKDKLTSILGNNCIIEHIGSTAIPGVDGKGVIDIMIVFENIKNIEPAIELLQKNGYFSGNDNFMSTTGAKESGLGDIHLHLTTKKDNLYSNAILFRDYLKKHSKERKEYNDLKHQLFNKVAENRPKYTELKGDFIEKIIKLAKALLLPNLIHSFITPNDEKKQNMENYNRSAINYQKKFNGINIRFEDIKLAFSYITKINPKTLEIGCGTGRDAKEIVKYTNDYLGIDLSNELLKLAKQNVSEAIFELNDFETYDYPTGIDVVFSFASLLHSDKNSLKIIIQKIYNALNIGGIIFISSKYGPYHKETLDKDGFGLKTYYFYTLEEIINLCPVGLDMIYQNVYEFKDQKTFSIILQKVCTN